MKNLIASLSLGLLLATPSLAETRTLDIGLAYDSTEKREAFVQTVTHANEELAPYHVKVVVQEEVEVYLPEQLSEEKLVFHTPVSFNTPQDYYFVISKQDYELHNPHGYSSRDDYAVHALTQDQVCLIDEDLPEEWIDEVIVQEVKRLFSGKENTTAVAKADDPYYQPEAWNEEVSPHKPFKREAYEMTQDEEQVTVTMTVGLDGVDETYARQLITTASERYSEEFGISFEVIAMYEHNLLNDSWDLSEEFLQLETKAEIKTNTYLLLSSQDHFGKLNGRTRPDWGCTWMEVGQEETENIMLHEFGHLFYVGHVFTTDAVMCWTPDPGRLEFLPSSKETILKYKHRTWPND